MTRFSTLRKKEPAVSPATAAIIATISPIPARTIAALSSVSSGASPTFGSGDKPSGNPCPSVSSVVNSSPTPIGGSKLRKVNFKTPPKPVAAETEKYPTIDDPTGEIYKLACDIKSQAAELETLEGTLDANKKRLATLAAPNYFDKLQGRSEIPSSLAIKTPAGDVLVTFKSQYKKLSEDAEPKIIELIGEELYAANFKQTFSYKIDGEALPTTDPANPDRCPAQEFVDELEALIAKFNVPDAVTRESGLKPTKEFHTARHRLLAPAANLALQFTAPMIIAIKTKGRDKATPATTATTADAANLVQFQQKAA